MFFQLTWFRRLPGFPLIRHHLFLHVPDGPGLPGFMIQCTLVVNVSSSQSQSYPGHQRTLGCVKEHRSRDKDIALEEHHELWPWCIVLWCNAAVLRWCDQRAGTHLSSWDPASSSRCPQTRHTPHDTPQTIHWLVEVWLISNTHFAIDTCQYPLHGCTYKVYLCLCSNNW